MLPQNGIYFRIAGGRVAAFHGGASSDQKSGDFGVVSA
jgi:hypothetical protein